MRGAEQVQIEAAFDFDHGENEEWSIQLRCAEGLLRLDRGGADVSVDGVRQVVADDGEYAAIYRHFAQLIGDKASDMDLQPLRIVADSFFVGSKESVAPFYE